MDSNAVFDVGDTMTESECGICILDECGNHEIDCPFHPDNLKNGAKFHTPYLNYGWVCPVCGRGNAPFNSTCPCKDNYTVTCGTNM